MATKKDRLLRLEKRLGVGEENKKTCLVSYDWPGENGPEHVEIRMLPVVFEKFCRDAEKIYGTGSDVEPAGPPPGL